MKIAYFAPIYFDYLKQRPQHFAELLSKKHEIIYIEPTISLMKYLLKGGTSFHKIDYQVNPNLRCSICRDFLSAMLVTEQVLMRYTSAFS